MNRAARMARLSILSNTILILLKLAVVPLVLYYFDKELAAKKDAQMRTFLKLIVLILALGPGLRNFLRLVMGV